MTTLLLGFAEGNPGAAAARVGFLAVLIWLSVIDLRVRRLPDVIVLPTLLAGLVLSGFSVLVTPTEAFLGAGGGYLALRLLAVLWSFRGTPAAGPAFGGGDLKAAAMYRCLDWGISPAGRVAHRVRRGHTGRPPRPPNPAHPRRRPGPVRTGAGARRRSRPDSGAGAPSAAPRNIVAATLPRLARPRGHGARVMRAWAGTALPEIKRAAAQAGNGTGQPLASQ